jgi:hypothetical protein
MSLRNSVALAACIVTAGCVTYSNVEKYDATKNQVGFKYALPRPYVLVTPNLDGSVDVKTVMLPDMDNQYVVTTKSFLSSYKYELAFDQGMLKSVTNKADAAALGAQALTNAAAVKKADIEASSTAKKEAAKDAAKASADAAKALSDAELELEVATAELKALTGNKDAKPEQVVDAQVKVARANSRVDFLRGTNAAGNRIASTAGNAIVSSSGNVPADEAGPNVKSADVWGPVLFAIIQKDNRVTLEALHTQVVHPTITAASADKPADDKPKVPKLSLSLANETTFKRSVDGTVVVPIKTNRKIAEVVPKRTLVQNQTTRETLRSKDYGLALKDDGMTVELTLRGSPRAGNYVATPGLIIDGEKEPTADAEIKFTVSQ